MQQPSLRTYRSASRVFSACLLSCLMVMMPLVEIAAASRWESGARHRRLESKPKNDDTSRQDTASSATEAGNVFLNAPVPQPAPEPLALFAPAIVATLDDGLASATTVAPGGTINYTANIRNNGVTSPADDALNVLFSNTIDAHTTLVAGSSVAAVSDKYNTIGNVQISVPDGTTDLLGNDFDPDTGNNAGMTTVVETKSSTQCTGGCSNNVAINANGSFTYNPPVGFSGTDTFTYTAQSGTSTATETVTITVANEIWFINNNAGACSANCNGRLSHPFTSLAAFNAANLGGAGQPGDNDWIFVYESATAYTGPAALRLGQKFIGQDATTSLLTLTGFTQPSGTDPLPAMNSANGTIVQITTSAPTTNGINLNSGNTLRGFTVGNTTGAKISGNNFGVLLVGNSASPDVTLNGTGQALNLTTGTLSVNGRFVSVATTSSTAQGISLAGVADSDGAGGSSFSFGSTTVSGSTTQGILIGTTTADLNLGNVSVTGGIDGISFQNNSAGTRTIGTLNVSGSSGRAFLHGAGGGNVTVSGAATLSSTNSAVDVSAPGGTNVINFQAATSATSGGAGNTAVTWAGVAGASITFSSLTIQRNNGTALNATGGGTVNVTSNTGSINNTTAGGPAIVANGVALNVNFSSINSTAGTNGVSLTGVTGTSGLGGGSLIGTATGATFLVSGGTTSVVYSGGITQAAANAMVSIAGGHTGTITFQTGTLNATSGTGLQFDNADGTYNFNGTNTLNGGDAGIDILNGSGGTFVFSASSTITSPTGTAFNVGTTPGSPNVTYSGSITDNTAAQRAVNIDGTTGGSISIATVTTASIAGGVGNTGININNANGNVTFTTLTMGTSATRHTAQAVTITGGTGTYGLGTVSIFTAGVSGLAATNADGTLNVTTGTVNNTNATAINIDGPASFTTLGISLTSVTSAGGATANGISIQDTNGTFTVVGDGTNTALGGNATGGTISNKSGANGNNAQGIGVFLNNTTGITLRRMTINGTNQNFGVRGTTVSNLTIEYSTINGSNGNDTGSDEGSLIFDGLTGTNTFTNLVVAGTIEDNFRVRNSSGVANNIIITGSTFTNAPNDNIIFSPSGNANLTAHVTNNTFTGAGGDHLQTDTSNTATLNIVFTGNLFSNGFPGSLLGGVTISGGNAGSAETVNFNISNNGTVGSPLIGSVQGGTININQGAGDGNWQGQVSNNIIGVAASAGSGSVQSSCIRVENHSPNGNLVASVLSNTCRAWGSGAGINFQVGDTGNVNASLDLTVTGNILSNPGAGTQHGVQGNFGANMAGTNAVCFDFKTNNVNLAGGGAPPNTGADLRLRQRFGSTVRLPGYVGGSTDLTAVNNFENAQNTLADSVKTSAFVQAPGGGFVGGAACTSPTVPLAPVTSDATLANVVKPETNEQAASIQLDQSAPSSKTNAPTVSNQPSLLSRAVNALSYFATEIHSLVEPTAHASSAEMRLDSGVRVTDAVTQSSQLRKDPDARSVRTTDERGPKPQVSHHPRLSRIRPLLVSGETVTANIGTLSAGSSVTITYQVTVNNPPNLTLLSPPRVSNQGTVSGSNFATVSTDDPTVGGATDPTVTLIDLFNTTTTLASNLNPSNSGEQVTFTATINETPAQATADPAGTVDFIDTSNANAVICNDVAVAAGSAQCQTSSLTAGTHNIRADYSGDGNFDPSQSNIVAQVVNACTTNPIVTSTADSGANTLREALANVCADNTITFDLAGAGPHTITLTTGALSVTRNVTVNNNSGESITINGNNASRVFNISGNVNVTLGGLTISGGQDTGGAGILNASTGVVSVINSSVSGNVSTSGGGGIVNSNTGTLNVISSTISGNSAATNGGGLSNSFTGTLNVINSTISGNSAAGDGGGIEDNNSGTINVVNSTITNNLADSDGNSTGSGGGISRSGATVTLHNTIVAGNFNEDGVTDAADDISGTMNAASSFNLIGTGGSGGLTNGVNNNQVGVASPGLGPLANNGGLTFTHALLPTSPAVETGSNANLPTDAFDVDGDVNTAETLPVDQRGTGFPRTADSADANTTQTVDIGAFELHPSIEDIANQTTNEDTPKNVVFNLGDDTGTLITGAGGSVTASSSNTTLVPNAPANLSFTGSGGSRTLQITPATNQTGTTTITATVTATNGRTATDTFDLTVGGTNDPPSGTNNTVSTAEDTAYTFTAADFGFTDPNDTPPNTLLAVKITTLPGLGTLTNNNVAVNAGDFIPVANINGGLLKFTPAANDTGSPYTSFTFQVQDNGGGTDLDPTPKTITINVTAVNDGPVNTVPGPQTTLVNTAKVFSSGNGNQISVADIDAASNTIQVTLTATNGTLTLSGTAGLSFSFSDANGVGQGDGTADSTMTFRGTLTNINNALNGLSFNPTAAFTGAASVQIISNDVGNTGTGGPLTDTDTVNITVNDGGAPVVTTTGGNLTYTENDPATAIDPGLTVTDSNSTDLVGATVAITAGFDSAQDTLGFTNQLGITGNYNSGTGVLTLSGTTTVANYQTAVRTVTYQNSSDNPTTSRTITFTVDDGTNTGSATRGITITAVNDAPVNTVPGTQATAINTPLTFSSGNGNLVSIADVDAGASVVQVTLTVTNGTLTLNGTSGLSFSFSDGNGTGAGDGTADTTMTFRGTIASINSALNGMVFTPTSGFNGTAGLTIITNDLGNTGTGGPQTDIDVINIQVATNIRIQDASVAEPTSGSTNMLFTVILSAPASSTVTVNYTTIDEPAGPGKAIVGQDYTLTSGTLTFVTGEQLKTIAVPVLSDGTAEPDETFLVNLSAPSGGAIVDGTATGTITALNTAGTFLISEIRTTGPGGAGDDFVEVYNNSNSAVTVAASDASFGYGLFKMGADCNATPILLGVIPNGAIIPAHAHFLFVGSQYSLVNYGGTFATAGNLTLNADIETDANVGIFSTTDVGNLSSVNRLDAVGFAANTVGNCTLLSEGTVLPSTGFTNLEGSYQRDQCGKLANSAIFGNCPTGGLPKDANNNVADFFWADTAATNTPAGQHLGAPGPENLASPLLRLTGLTALLVDATKAATLAPNRERDFTVVPNGASGTMTIRRRYRNDTGATVTRLRFRVVDISTAPTLGGIADIRALTSSDFMVTTNDSQTCMAFGLGGPPCIVTVKGTTVEEPPAQAIGGGNNTTLTVTLGTPLPAGASVNIQWRLGVQTSGSFKFFINVEALP